MNITFDESHSGIVDLKIYNLEGKLIYNEEYDVEQGILNLDLSEANVHSPGTYFININNDKRRLGEFKFVKINP